MLTAGAKGDLLYYVMPLIEGESLRSRLLRKGEFPVSDVAWILRDAASALAYAHSHGVVHRDIKPDNILLTGNRAVKATITPGGGRTSSAYSRALIAAGLGDRAAAATLLQHAFAEGNYFEPYLHREIEFQAIQDYPALKEMLWPTG